MHRNQLRNLLQNYHPIDPDEQLSKKQMLEFLETHSDCFERTCIPGHFTASAWLLNKDGSEALLLLHGKLNEWLQAGGHCDGDPDVLRVAIKEAQEESGIMDIKPVFAREFEIRKPVEAGFPDITDSSASRVETVSAGIQKKELDPGSQETLKQQPATPKRKRGESCQAFHRVREDKSIPNSHSAFIFDIDVHLIPPHGSDPEHIHYDVCFLLQVQSDEPLICSAESHALRWFGKDKTTLPTQDRSIMRMFEKWLELLGSSSS